MDDIKDQNPEDPHCWLCGKRGGKRQVDPYDAEIHDKRIIKRLHEQCAQSLRDEI